MNRRQFAGHLAKGSLAVAVLGGTLSLEACPGAKTVWDDIKTWLPTGIASFEAIMALVVPLAAPGINAIAEIVKAAFATLSAAVDQYMNAPADQKATWLGRVETAFKDVTDNIQAFLTALGQSSNPIVKLVLVIATIILSTISAFLGKIGPTPVAFKLKLGQEEVLVVPVLRDRKKFVADFNAACVSGGHAELQIH
jgi:hypothetical protein